MEFFTLSLQFWVLSLLQLAQKITECFFSGNHHKFSLWLTGIYHVAFTFSSYCREVSLFLKKDSCFPTCIHTTYNFLPKSPPASSWLDYFFFIVCLRQYNWNFADITTVCILQHPKHTWFYLTVIRVSWELPTVSMFALQAYYTTVLQLPFWCIIIHIPPTCQPIHLQTVISLKC